MKKSLKITLITIASIIGVFLILICIISPITTSYINKNGEELLGRKIKTDKCNINLFTGRVKVENFTIFEEDGEQPWASFDTLNIKANLLKLIAHNIYIKQITLSGLNVNILQNDSTFNFSSIIQHFQPTDTLSKKEKSNKWKFAFYNIDIRHGKVFYSDQQRQCDWNIKDINFKAPGFSIGKHASTNAGLKLKLADGGTMQTKASYDVTNNNFKIDININEMSLDNAKAYLNELIKIGKTEGTLNAHLIAEGNISQFLATNLYGDIHLNDIKIKSQSKEEILKCHHLTTKINTLELNKKQYDIDAIKIDGLVSHLDLYPEGNNFQQLFTKDTTTTETKDSLQSPTPIQFKIASLNLTNGAFTYTDHTNADIFELPLTNITITAKDINLHHQNNAHIQATLPRDGNIDITWSGNIYHWKEFQDLTLTLSGLRIKELSPYTTTYLGYPFKSGTLTLQSTNHIRNEKVEANHHIEISKATIGKKNNSNAQFKIPLKAALYILSDRDNNIKVDIPVTGDLSNPEFKYMRAVWNAIGNMLLKVASEPFKWASNAFGISNNDNFIVINPTDSNFTNTQLHFLKKYANAIKKEPTLKIHFQQHVDATAEDFILDLADARNRVLQQHLINQLNIDTSRFDIVSIDFDGLNKPGYLITGELIDSLEVD